MLKRAKYNKLMYDNLKFIQQYGGVYEGVLVTDFMSHVTSHYPKILKFYKLSMKRKH